MLHVAPGGSPSRKRKVQRPSTDPRTKLEASGKTLTTRDWNLRGDSNCRSGRGSMRMLNSSMAPALRLYALLEDASIWPPATTTRSRAASMLITVEARGTTCTQRGVRTSNTRSALSKPADTTAPISGMGTTLRTPASCCSDAVVRGRGEGGGGCRGGKTGREAARGEGRVGASARAQGRGPDRLQRALAGTGQPQHAGRCRRRAPMQAAASGPGRGDDAAGTHDAHSCERVGCHVPDLHLPVEATEHQLVLCKPLGVEHGRADGVLRALVGCASVGGGGHGVQLEHTNLRLGGRVERRREEDGEGARWDAGKRIRQAGGEGGARGRRPEQSDARTGCGLRRRGPDAARTGEQAGAVRRTLASHPAVQRNLPDGAQLMLLIVSIDCPACSSCTGRSPKLLPAHAVSGAWGAGPPRGLAAAAAGAPNGAAGAPKPAVAAGAPNGAAAAP